MSTLKTVTAVRAAELMRAGAALVDIREPDEHAREHIPGARHHAVNSINLQKAVRPGNNVLIFHCRSGARTQANAGRLSAAAPGCELYMLEGGIDAWKKAGLPIAIDRRQPIEMMRQVQLVAGSLAFLGAALGYAVTPVFYALSGFVGLGLMFAGITGYCGMAKVLALMPWNRPPAAPALQG